MPGDLYRFTPRKAEDNPNWFDKSRILLTSGCFLCCISGLASILALSLPYWVYVEGTMETTVAGLTDDTEVTYFYGLMTYCLKMKATHVNIDKCESLDDAKIKSWERVTLATVAAGLALLVTSLVMVLLNFLCWNKRFLLILATFCVVASGACTSVGVSLYQIEATVQVLDIGGLTKANFEPRFLYMSFWFAFASAATAILTGFLFLFGTVTWVKPKEPRLVLGGRYKTTVKPQRCPYKGRKPAVISITQM